MQQHSNVTCTVFEREESLEARAQGGCLDLHVESGQAALIAANLFEKAKALLRYEGQDTRVLSTTGEILFDSIEEDHHRPEIDRKQLRQLLIDSVESGTILWNYNLQLVVEKETGKYELQFQNGKTASGFDLVVGADGAWSKGTIDNMVHF